jgi:hypothetical protein
MSTPIATPESAAPDAPKPGAVPVPEPKAARTPEEARADALFGDQQSTEAGDPVAEMFGVREVRGKIGKGARHAKSLNADLDAPKPKPAKPASAPGKAGEVPPAAGERGGTEHIEAAPETPAPEPETPAEDDAPEYTGELGIVVMKHGRYRVPKPVADTIGAMRGQYQAFERRAKDGVESAHSWKAHAESLQARLDAAEQGRTPQAASSPAQAANPASGARPATTTSGEQKGLLEAVDWQTFERLQQNNPTLALQWLTEATEKHVSSQIEAAIARIEAAHQEKFSPLLENQQQIAELSKAESFFIKMAETQDDSGYWYPEIVSGDSTFVTQMGRIWKDYPEDFRYTQRGFDAAYNQTRNHLARIAASMGPRGVKAPAHPGASAAPSSAPDLFPPEPGDPRAHGVLSGQSISAPRPTAPQSQSDRGAALVDAIGNSETRESVFGVRVPARRR